MIDKKHKMSVANLANLKERFLDIKFQLRKDKHTRFYGEFAFGIEWILSDEYPTAWTDFRALYFNPEFVEPLNDKQFKGLVIHEIDHIARKHNKRLIGKDRGRAGEAFDHIINLGILANGYELPPDGCYDKRFIGLSEEEVYDILEEESKKNKCGGGQDWGQCIEGEPLSKDEVENIERVIKNAAIIAKSQGMLPGHLEDYLQGNEESRVNWKDYIKAQMEPIFVRDVSWAVPNRKLIHMGIYAPGAVKEGTGELAILVDTSGSMSLEEINQIISEYEEIKDTFQPSAMHLVFFDSQVWRYDKVEMFDELPVLDKLRQGGTSFRAPLDYLRENNIEPLLCIYMTDGYAPLPEEPNFPVIWCSSQKEEEFFTWGDFVKLELE